MHQTVLDVFPSFSRPLEGEVSSMYVDILGLVTTSIGCLIDPVSLALPLPWKHEKTGERATQAEISAAWHGLKSVKDKYSKLHWRYAAGLNDLRLDQADSDDLVRGRLLANEKILRGYFPNWDFLAADGMLGILSMSWALGAGFPRTFGNFRAAVNAQDWTGAIASCGIRTEGNPGIIPRNSQNRLCFSNAASVLAQGLPLDTLFYPGTAPNGSQRDEALRLEAELAAKAHNDRLFNALTTHLVDNLDLRHDPHEYGGSEDSEDKPTDTDTVPRS